MRKVILLLLFISGIVFAQSPTIETKTNYCVYMYEDTAMNFKRDCIMDVSISTEQITVNTITPLIVTVTELMPEEKIKGGSLLIMYGKDNNGTGCMIKLLITEAQKELHIIYQNLEMAFILDN